jgi:hypothetical protein
VFWIAYVAAAHGAALRSKRVGGRFGGKIGFELAFKGSNIGFNWVQIGFFWL